MSVTVRLLTRSRRRVTVFGLVLSLLVATRSGRADMPDTLPAWLEVLWSAPITTEMTPEGTFGRSEGLVLSQGAVAPDGAVVFLGGMLGGQRPGRVLLLDAEKAGPDGVVPLQLPTPDPPGLLFTGTWFFKRQRPNRNPVVMSLAIGGEGAMWLGGFSNSYMGIASDAHRDAYLAKLDSTGKPIWERSYGKGGWLAIESIAPAAAGGVVGVGRGMDASWLAKIAADGTLLLERRIGNGKGVAAAPLRGGRFLVAGLAGEGEGSAYRDNVSTWLLDEAGALHGPARIRDAINREGSSNFGRVAASAVADDAYVVSNWSDSFHPQAVEIARVGSDGALLWRQALPDTISPRETKVATFDTCNPALVTLANGDALVACALNGSVQLYRLDGETGEQRTVRLPLPECQRAHPAALFLMVRRDGTVFLAGSRSGGNVAANCSWIGRLTL